MLFILIFAALSLFGFFARFIPKANNLVDILMVGVSLFVILTVLKCDRYIRKDQALLVTIIVFFTLSLVVSLIINLRINAIIQYILYIVYLTPLLLLRNISAEDAYKIFLPLLLLIGIIQLPFDLLFPRVGLDIRDAYSGTFSIANDKSRYLFISIIGAVFVYRFKNRLLNLTVLPLTVIAMLVSFKLGDSVFAYLFSILALLLGLCHRKKWLVLAISLSLALSVVYIFHEYEDEPFIIFTYNRFFDSDHGAYAIVHFAFKQLEETFFLGTGLGEFATRTSQTMDGLFLKSIPRTMITYGEIYEKSVAPAGLPSYILIIAESGIIGMIISGLLIYHLYTSAHPSFLGFTFLIYILILAIFSPAFYEGPDGAIFLYSYFVINKALNHVAPHQLYDIGQSQASV